MNLTSLKYLVMLSKDVILLVLNWSLVITGLSSKTTMIPSTCPSQPKLLLERLSVAASAMDSNRTEGLFWDLKKAVAAQKSNISELEDFAHEEQDKIP